MPISKAAQPPVQPTASLAERKHPRYPDYLRYKAAMSALLVTADTFDLWLQSIEEDENPRTVVFEVKPHSSPNHLLAPGWYKHHFGPHGKLLSRTGPFSTQAEAAKT